MRLLTLTLKNITDKWIRFALTGLAVVLGVGFVVGVFIITDGLRSTFGDLAQDIAGDIDLYVRAEQAFGDDEVAGQLDPAIVDDIAAVDGVEFAEGGVFGLARVAGPDGETLGEGFRGGFNFGEGSSTYLVTEGEFAGRPPEGPDEFTINLNAAEDENLELGETYTVSSIGGVRDMTLVGTFTWADPTEDKTIGGTLIALDLDTAIELFVGGGGINQVAVGVADGADPQVVQAAVSEVVPAGTEVVTNEVVTDETTDDFNSFIDIFGNILLSFAIVTLVVSAFIIFNTFSIVIGQRIRELGLLRALGATGGQITWSILGEAFVVGVVATGVGIVGGIGIAWLLRAILNSLGGGFPSGPLPIEARTIVVAVVMGIVVTMVSALIPALKARRVSPMAALRDDVGIGSSQVTLHPRFGVAFVAVGLFVLGLGIIRPEGIALTGLLAAVLLYFGGSRLKAFVGRFSVLSVGVVLLLVAAVADMSTTALLSALAIGALLTFVGVNLVSPLFARPVASLVGTKFLGIVLVLLGGLLAVAAVVGLVGLVGAVVDGNTAGSFGLLVLVLLAGAGAALCLTTFRSPFGVEGPMGTRNAGRNPRRTSSTAAALMIGLALVGTVTVLGASLKKSFTAVIDDTVAADWFICLEECQGFDGISPQMSTELREVPEVESVVQYRFAEDGMAVRETGAIEDSVVDILSADFARLDEHLDADYISGGSDDASADSLLLYEDTAEDFDLTVGDTVPVTFASGAQTSLTVAGIYSDNRILGDWVISNEAYDDFLPPAPDVFVSAITAGGVSEDDARSAIESVTSTFPDVEVRDSEEFRDSQAAQIDQALVVINVFLGLALVIALVGIANTLALSVFERTREIGLLRAVGASRAQTSTMIRWEGAIIAVFGGLLGLGLGIVFGLIAVVVIPDNIVDQFDIPAVQLATYIVVAALAGLFAAYFPARRAARLDVLEAIATE